jgi:hypothetical protein
MRCPGGRVMVRPRDGTIRGKQQRSGREQANGHATHHKPPYLAQETTRPTHAGSGLASVALHAIDHGRERTMTAQDMPAEQALLRQNCRTLAALPHIAGRPAGLCS